MPQPAVPLLAGDSLRRVDALLFVAALAVIVAVGALGLGLVTDFRGMRTAHVRQTVRLFGSDSKVPPWRWLPSDDERMIRSQDRNERAIGWAFLVAAVLFFLGWLVSGLRAYLL
jgi:hypothetical protein